MAEPRDKYVKTWEKLPEMHGFVEIFGDRTPDPEELDIELGKKTREVLRHRLDMNEARTALKKCYFLHGSESITKCDKELKTWRAMWQKASIQADGWRGLL